MTIAVNYRIRTAVRLVHYLSAALAIVALLLCTSTASAAKPKKDPDALFDKLDKNGDGKVGMTEYMAAMTRAKGKKGVDKSDAIEKRFKAKDKDNDGYLTREEFKAHGKKAKQNQ